MGDTVDEHASACPASGMGERHAVRGEQAQDDRGDVEGWLKTTGLLAT
jgi:hypothetical protein